MSSQCSSSRLETTNSQQDSSFDHQRVDFGSFYLFDKLITYLATTSTKFKPTLGTVLLCIQQKLMQIDS